jgi:hypothetical protein
MHIEYISRPGIGHINAGKGNEDNYALVRPDGPLVYGAVFDGCSTGRNSHFASQLMAYSFKKNVRSFQDTLANLYDREDYARMLRVLFNNMRVDMRETAHKLDLTEFEMLATAVFFVYHEDTEKLVVSFLGDGVLYHQTEEGFLQMYFNDEANTPEYLGYYINRGFEDFYEYLDGRKMLVLENIRDFSVGTDGAILKNWDNVLRYGNDLERASIVPDPIQALVVNVLEDAPQNELNLERRYNILTHKTRGKWFHHDDFTLIRVRK